MMLGNASRLRLRDFPKLVAVFRDAERRKRLFSQPDLTYLFWESTLRCNLRCQHCGSSCEARAPGPELTTEQVLGILNSIAEDFDARRIFVSITGGEPLLRADVFEVNQHMTRLGMRTCMVTNGTLLGESQAKKLLEGGMRTISISVDGLGAEHEQMRGAGTYSKALKAITQAREAGFDVVEAITCVRPANLASLPALEKEVYGAGAHLWRLITIDKMGRGVGAETKALWLRPPEVRQLLDFIEKRRIEQQKAGQRPTIQFSCGGFLGVRRELSVRPGDGQCFAGLCVASILSDGQVSACPSLPRSWAQGSALKTRFSEIWRTRFTAYRDTAWRKAGPCARCSWFSLCQGGGLHERLAQPEEFCWLDRQED